MASWCSIMMWTTGCTAQPRGPPFVSDTAAHTWFLPWYEEGLEQGGGAARRYLSGVSSPLPSTPFLQCTSGGA
jgi:hypothetical protein